MKRTRIPWKTREENNTMTFDASKLTPAARKEFIRDGRRFSSERTLAQANRTILALDAHGAKLVDHGFGPEDTQDLKDARDALSAADVGRESKRADKKTTSITYVDAMQAAQQTRLRGRSVLGSARRILVRTEGEAAAAAVRSIDALLMQTSVAADDADKMATQLDQIRETLDTADILAVTASRGGPKAISDLTAQAVSLRSTSQASAEPRGTPEHTELLDLLDGVIISLTRAAREAADVASKTLGEPALLTAFELTELYATGRAKAKSEGDPKEPTKPSAAPLVPKAPTAPCAAPDAGAPKAALEPAERKDESAGGAEPAPEPAAPKSTSSNSKAAPEPAAPRGEQTA
jgi:hypothetical protein